MTGDAHERHPTSVTTPSDTEIRVERIFDAPREVVWEIYTDPALIPDWLGPRELTMSIETMDIRPGGSYRYTSQGPGGEVYVVFGDYREVVPPRLLVFTLQFEGMADPWTQRTELSELDGDRTRIVEVMTFASKEDRDSKLQAGMERGFRDGHERLVDLLARPRPRQ